MSPEERVRLMSEHYRAKVDAYSLVEAHLEKMVSEGRDTRWALDVVHGLLAEARHESKEKVARLRRRLGLPPELSVLKVGKS